MRRQGPGSPSALVADEIRVRRHWLNWRQVDLAAALRWTPSSVSSVETAAAKITVEQLVAVAVALDVPLTKLLAPVIELVETQRNAQGYRYADDDSREEDPSGDSEDGVKHE